MVWRFICVFFHSSLTSYGMNYFLIFYSSLACPFQGLGLAWLWIFLSLAHSLLLPWFCYHSFHATLLFMLWCYLTRSSWASFEPVTCSSLNWLQWPNMVIGFILMLLWAFSTHYIVCGLLWLISFSLDILVHFLILHFHRLLLTLLGFLGPITVSFILGPHGLCINPLLSYFMLWPILTFLHHIMPMSLLLLSLGSFRPICFPQCPFIYFMGLWSIVLAICAW